MPRNAVTPLSPADAARAAEAAAVLTVGETYAVEYVKRDGTAAELIGAVVGFVGTPGQSSYGVTVETDRGFRTANLSSITLAYLWAAAYCEMCADAPYTDDIGAVCTVEHPGNETRNGYLPLFTL